MKKIISVKSLEKVISKLKAKGKKVVLCHGVFDLLHIGHIKHFKEAKKLGDILVATVTQDKYVNKGPNRPIFSLNTRMESIAALKDIDYVAPNIFSNAIQLIKMLKPDIYCKGKDYKNYNLDATSQIKKEAAAIKSVGGKITHTGTVLFSSSKIINQTSLNLSNEQNPTHLYTSPGTYYINLLVTDADGCISQISQEIKILQDYYSYSPNIFTPNEHTTLVFSSSRLISTNIKQNITRMRPIFIA